MERRKLTKEDIDKVRDVEGFPIATDDAIIELSDAPYYTACPNPFIKDFIDEYGTPYDEDTDDYKCEPFAADISEGKTDAVYMAHTYHTKVPYRAIMHYILHYTKPGALILDGFAGTGMTALAAKLCGSDNPNEKASFSSEETANWGARNAIIGDLSPIATFIAHNYLSDVDLIQFHADFQSLIERCNAKYSFLYQTIHNPKGNPSIEGQMTSAYGTINYVVWSDIFLCPQCGSEFVFWNEAIKDNEVLKTITCPHCGAQFKKSDCERSQTNEFDVHLGKTVQFAKQVPVLINYTYCGKTYNKVPDAHDLEVIQDAKDLADSISLPIDELPDGDNTSQPIHSHGFQYVHQFFYSRSALLFSFYFSEANSYSTRDALKFVGTSILLKTGSKLHNIGFKNGKLNLAGAMPNVLYVPSTVAERNIIQLLEKKYKDICKVFAPSHSTGKAIIQCCSCTDMGIPEKSIDYIFTDPPFGSNINYSEMNYIWESWIRVKTNPRCEAIINKTQHKHLAEYQELMTKCFIEYYRALKPGRWMTVEFHNSKNAVWAAIQQAIMRSGFVIADVRTLDKKQGTFKQMTTVSAVKQDLIISAYKPKEAFTQIFNANSGTPEGAWSFVAQHLSNLPVTVIEKGQIQVIAERQAYLLFDRMVAYHVMRGTPVPLDATDFYRGLDERFIKRDDMYFLPDQVTEYDTARLKMKVESVQTAFLVTNEKTAIGWLYQLLGQTPMTYQEIQPKFMQQVKTVDRYEDMPGLAVLLEENFIQDDRGRWYVPDPKKEGDVAKLREKSLLREFDGYLKTKGKLKLFRSEAIRAGFSKLWKDKNYQAIVDIAERLPTQTVQEDQNLLMYYDISLSRIGQA